MLGGVIKSLLVGVIVSQVSYALPRAIEPVALSVRPRTPQGKPARVVQRISLVRVYTPSWFKCDWCEILEGVLKARGVTVLKSRDKKIKMSEFPTCVYSDGTTDSGKLVHDRKALTLSPVKFIEVTP